MSLRQSQTARRAAKIAVPQPLVAAPADAVEEAHAVAALVPPEVRVRMIAEAAYYRAELRGFEPGHDFEDWIEAEAEIDRLIAVEQLVAS